VQTRELREYCERRGWQIVGEYCDTGISGTKEKRPELDRLMADAHKRRFDVCCVWRFDRMARSVSHLLRVLETFNAQGIEFVSFSEQLDTATPAGRMVFTVLGAVAELERSLICERVRAGLRNAKAKGKSLGRPKKSLDAAKIASLRKQGRSWRKIARIMECSTRSARRALQDAGQKCQMLDFATHEGPALALNLNADLQVADSVITQDSIFVGCLEKLASVRRSESPQEASEGVRKTVATSEPLPKRFASANRGAGAGRQCLAGFSEIAQTALSTFYGAEVAFCSFT
jgi:DNA invertase Pin-like site-specific DNA recombinase